jgi:hypothetical protein
MAQPTYTQIRAALASYLTTAVTNPDGSGLRASANRPAQVNTPCAIVAPTTGTFARYQVSMDGQADFIVRVILLVAPADSAFGEGILDPYISVTGAQSIPGAVRRDPTLGGQAADAAVTEATGYGMININGIDYLGAHFITEIFL